MYKYERSASYKESDNSKKYKSKPNFDDVLEFKRGLPEVRRINAEIAMGVSENSANRRGAYLHGIGSGNENHTIQLSGKHSKRPIRIKGTSRKANQTTNKSKRLPTAASVASESEPPPLSEQPIPTEFTEQPKNCRSDQINTILSNPFQDQIEDKDTGVQYYHIRGCYPSNGKPIWIIENGKIKIVGMYKHPKKSNKVYKKKPHTGDGPKFINLL